MQWVLDLVVIGLLIATLFHALRLERALGVLKRDRAVLEELVAGFNGATRQAEGGIERLRSAVDGAGRGIARQIEAAGSLKDDLVYLIDRGERLADRMDGQIRAGRGQPDARPGPAAIPARESVAAEEGGRRPRSQAEQDLLAALRVAR